MRPMLASATPDAGDADPGASSVPSGPEWLHEVKWDGMRVLVDSRDGRTRVTARSEADVSAAFPELAGISDLLAVDGDDEVAANHDGLVAHVGLFIAAAQAGTLGCAPGDNLLHQHT